MQQNLIAETSLILQCQKIPEGIRIRLKNEEKNRKCFENFFAEGVG